MKTHLAYKALLIQKRLVIIKEDRKSLDRVFSRDVTADMLVSLNKGTAAKLVSPINPTGIEFYSYVNVSNCFG